MSNTIVAIEKNSWLRTERRASLLRLALVVAVHVALVAALLSWSWPPAPIEVSILSLEDLGGDVPASQEVPTAEGLKPDVDGTKPSAEVSPAAAAPALELAQPQQMDIALSQVVTPAVELQVAPERVSEPLPKPEAQPYQASDTAPTTLTQPTTSSPSGTSSISSESGTPNSVPTPPKTPAAPKLRPPPDFDASTRSGSAAKVTTPNGGATATANLASTGKTGLAGQASGSAQSGAGTEPALTAARFDADYLHNPAPAYPSQSRRLKEEGTVLLLVRVSDQGTPISVEIRTSSGFERLDEAGLQAVRQWRFVPAKRGSDNVAASVLVPIQFKRQ